MKRNTELRAMAGIERVEAMVLRKRLRWLGHVERMNDTRTPASASSCVVRWSVSAQQEVRREDGTM